MTTAATITLSIPVMKRARPAEAARSTPYVAEGNAVLAALSAVSSEVLSAGRRIDLPAGRKLWEAGQRQDYVYFPDSGLVSVLWTTPKKAEAETGVVAADGALGILEALLDAPVAFTSRALLSGSGWLLPAETLRDLVAAEPAAAAEIWKLVYRQDLESRIGAACRALHPVRARLADSLLNYAERVGAYERLTLTHEVLAATLGVCRTTITAMMADLAGGGAIIAGRGKIAIFDFDKLDGIACGCRRHTGRFAADSGGQEASL